MPTIWEAFTNGWHNPYLYDGQELVRYDAETSLYWLSVRAYDPMLGRFLTHDPLGRNQGTWSTQPYAYAANNPLRNIDPNGQIPMGVTEENGNAYFHRKLSTTITTTPGNDPSGDTSCSQSSHCMDQYRKWKAWLDPVLSGGLLGAAFFDVTVFGLEGIPLAGEIAALFGGNIEVLGSAILHLTDVVFAGVDFVRDVSEIFGASPDGGWITFLRTMEGILGIFDLIANVVAGIFAFFNPLEGLENMLRKVLFPKIESGLKNFVLFMAVHLGLQWLPMILGLSVEAFDGMTPDEAMAHFPWMLNINPPTPLAGQ